LFKNRQTMIHHPVRSTMKYRFVYPTGYEAVLTPDQRIALEKVAAKWQMTGTIEVSPMFGGDGAIIVNVGTMWLAVEVDGYTHS